MEEEEAGWAREEDDDEEDTTAPPLPLTAPPRRRVVIPEPVDDGGGDDRCFFTLLLLAPPLRSALGVRRGGDIRLRTVFAAVVVVVLVAGTVTAVDGCPFLAPPSLSVCPPRRPSSRLVVVVGRLDRYESVDFVPLPVLPLLPSRNDPFMGLRSDWNAFCNFQEIYFY